MMNKKGHNESAIRYSEAFKMEIVRELERDGLPFDHVRRKYGIAGSWTVQKWVHKYGNGSRGKVIRVEKPEEINEKEQLKRRVRALEGALADANIDLALDAVAIRLGFWNWGQGLHFEYFGVPYANFWAWFWVVFFFSLGYCLLARRADWVGAWISPLLALIVGLQFDVDVGARARLRGQRRGCAAPHACRASSNS